MPPTLYERTRSQSDPVRNFKFQVELLHPTLHDSFATIGFQTVEGLSMTTDMVPYREGGWNTNPHKLPGQSDFAPLSLNAGVFYTKPGMWDLAKQMFSTQWGAGTLGTGAEFRYDMVIRILDHPVTQGPASGVAGGIQGAVMAFWFYNCWTAAIGFGGLNSMSNDIFIHQMQVHHEGFDVFFGNVDSVNLTHSGENVLPGTL
jgi:hypothetical protein